MAAPAAAAPFSVGERVTVLDLRKPGHVRTPDYILGHTGVVVQFCGCFLNPEDLSLGNTSGPVVPLYRVQFLMSELWPEPQHHPNDTLCIEISGHWLKAAGDTPR
jgi:nitrile hydratase